MGHEDEKSRQRIKKNLEARLLILEAAVYDFPDPATANLNILHSFYKQKILVEKVDVSLTPQDHLMALDNLENWFVSRSLPYPQPEHIAQQRTFWQARVKGQQG